MPNLLTNFNSTIVIQKSLLYLCPFLGHYKSHIKKTANLWGHNKKALECHQIYEILAPSDNTLLLHLNRLENFLMGCMYFVCFFFFFLGNATHSQCKRLISSVMHCWYNLLYPRQPPCLFCIVLFLVKKIHWYLNIWQTPSTLRTWTCGSRNPC